MAVPVAFIVQGAMAMKDKMGQANKAMEEMKKQSQTWIPVAGNPYHEFQRYMYFSTKRKFEAEGISRSGRKRWWKRLKPDYGTRKRKSVGSQKILTLKGRIGRRFYAGLLKKRIKKNRPNLKFMLLTAPVEWAEVHQKGSRKFNIPKRPFFTYTSMDLRVRNRLLQNFCFGTLERFVPGLFEAFPVGAASGFQAYARGAASMFEAY